MNLPPSYSESTQQHASVVPGLSYKDFLPLVLSTGGVFSQPECEPFPVLIQRANEFLQQNPGVEAKTCESVEFCSNINAPNTELSAYIEGKVTCFIRALRLWLVVRTDPSLPPQQIGYFNNLPQLIAQTAFKTEFEPFDSLMKRINTVLKENPLAGRILNMESQEMKLPRSGTLNFQPDKSFFVESNERGYRYVFVIRIFYEFGNHSNELLGCLDFAPNLVSSASFTQLAKYEPFSAVLARAMRWCSENGGVRFCNAQTLQVKIKREGSVDSNRMAYLEHGKFTQYVRVLRLVYTTPFVQSDVVARPLALNCRSFPPVVISIGGCGGAQYESNSMTRYRMEHWINAAGARVVSAETILFKQMLNDNEGYDSSYTYETGQIQASIYLLRVFFDGPINDPPPSALPQVAPVIQESCCQIL